MTARLPDRYLSGYALWRAEHPRSRAPRWLIQWGVNYSRCVACRDLRVTQAPCPCAPRHAFIARAACVRWLCALPEVTDDALPWLRALPQGDQDAVVVARAL